MKRLICRVVTGTLLCCAGFAQTQPAVQPGSGVPSVLPAATPLGTGPFKAIMQVDPTLAKHTAYRPNDMRTVGSSEWPIMAWGNGACAADGNEDHHRRQQWSDDCAHDDIGQRQAYSQGVAESDARAGSVHERR